VFTGKKLILCKIEKLLHTIAYFLHRNANNCCNLHLCTMHTWLTTTERNIVYMCCFLCLWWNIIERRILFCWYFGLLQAPEQAAAAGGETTDHTEETAHEEDR